jgi:hypothetical protein
MGGNVAGLSFQQTDLAGKRLELLREIVPALRQLAILANAGNPLTLLDMREVEAAAGTLGLTVVTVEIHLAVIDDPIRSHKDADSQAVRDRTWDWYKTDLLTRLRPGGRVVLIQTRWHEDDLAGRILAEAGTSGAGNAPSSCVPCDGKADARRARRAGHRADELLRMPLSCSLFCSRLPNPRGGRTCFRKQ